MKKNKSRPAPLTFSIRVKGDRVGEARLSANDVAEIVKCTQQTFKRIGQVLYGDSSIGKGRKKKDIEQLCELYLIGWQTGSSVMMMELAEPPRQLDMFGYVGEESLKSFFGGMEMIKDIQSADLLPHGFDKGVLQAIDSLSKVLDHGIDTIEFQSESETGTRQFQITENTRSKYIELLQPPINQLQIEKVGRLETLNGHGSLTGYLWEADGTKWLCNFKYEHQEILKEAWLRNVKLIGEAITEQNKTPILNVNTLFPIGDEDKPEIGYGDQSYWSSQSLESLIAQQNILPVDDPEELGNLWPVDDDPDEMHKYFISEREARRRLVREE